MSAIDFELFTRYVHTFYLGFEYYKVGVDNKHTIPVQCSTKAQVSLLSAEISSLPLGQ